MMTLIVEWDDGDVRRKDEFEMSNPEECIESLKALQINNWLVIPSDDGTETTIINGSNIVRVRGFMR